MEKSKVSQVRIGGLNLCIPIGKWQQVINTKFDTAQNIKGFFAIFFWGGRNYIKLG